MEVNIDKMLAQQKRDNIREQQREILRLPQREDIAEIGELINIKSQTLVREDEDGMQLCRFINTKLCRINFNYNVALKEVVEYFDIDDYMFKKMSV